jgi:hypothetical protein
MSLYVLLDFRERRQCVQFASFMHIIRHIYIFVSQLLYYCKTNFSRIALCFRCGQVDRVKTKQNYILWAVDLEFPQLPCLTNTLHPFHHWRQTDVFKCIMKAFLLSCTVMTNVLL